MKPGARGYLAFVEVIGLIDADCHRSQGRTATDEEIRFIIGKFTDQVLRQRDLPHGATVVGFTDKDAANVRNTQDNGIRTP